MTRAPAARLWHGALACALSLVSGCSQPPSYDIEGALFPGWLVCVAAGILLASAGRWLMQRARIAIAYPALAYPCLAAAFTFAIWLIFFQ
jgi:YtcA-like protein